MTRRATRIRVSAFDGWVMRRWGPWKEIGDEGEGGGSDAQTGPFYFTRVVFFCRFFVPETAHMTGGREGGAWWKHKFSFNCDYVVIY